MVPAAVAAAGFQVPAPAQPEDLRKTLEELQESYFATKGGATSSVQLFHDVVRPGPPPPPPSFAERAIAELDKAAAARGPGWPQELGQVPSGLPPEAARDEQLLRKDDMDMAFHQLCSDASRMRASLAEVDLAMARGSRAQVVAQARRSGVSRGAVLELQDQHQLLLEQRQVLEQLRRERHQAEDDQFWFLREHRQRRQQGDPGEPDLLPPETVAEVRAQLRSVGDGPLEVAAGAAQPPQDGYFLAELSIIDGIDYEYLVGARYEVQIRSARQQAVVARIAADGPVGPDGDVSPTRLPLAVPSRAASDDLVAEITLRGIDGSSASGRVPLARVGSERGEPKALELLAVAGLWAEWGVQPRLEAALRYLPPRSETRADGERYGGERLAHTRASPSLGDCPRSAFPGPELPPSQAYLRQRAAAWEQAGCPTVHDAIWDEEVQDFAREWSAMDAGEPPQAALPPPPPPPLTSASLMEPESQPEPDSSEEEPTPTLAGSPAPGGRGGPAARPKPPPANPGGAFFAGWEELGSPQDPSTARRPSPGLAATTLAADAQQQPGSTSPPSVEPSAPPARRPRGTSPGATSPAPAASVADGARRRGGARHRGTASPADRARARDLAEDSGQPPGHAASVGVGVSAEPSGRVLGIGSGTDDGDFNGLRFAAFAGDEGGGRMRVALHGAPSGGLLFKPPSSQQSLEEIFADLRANVEAGQLGTQAAAQNVLEFAARAAQPKALVQEVPDEARLCVYAAMILDALDTYPKSAILGLWLVEALISIYSCAGDHRAQLAVPLFMAFARAALRFATEPDSEMHRRLLTGLALTATPDCRIDTAGLVDYILSRLDGQGGRLPPVFAEHALAVLCVVRLPRKLSDQIRHSLHMLRGYKSDTHLAMRAMVTLAELFELVGEELRLTTLEHAESQEHVDPDSRRRPPEVWDWGVPKDGTDVRLVATMLDLYPIHRKMAGAGLRAFASMCKVSKRHLRSVMVDNLRVVMQAQQYHAKSRSVSLHISEVLAEAAKQRLELLVEGAVVLVANILREFPRDPAIVTNATDVLRICVTRGELLSKLLDVLPAPTLVTIGEVHHMNAPLMASLCELLAAEAAAGTAPRAELVDVGAVAVPVRALEALPHDASVVDAAARALKRMAYGPGCEAAAQHVRRLGGLTSLFNALGARAGGDASVRNVLSAIACFGQDRSSRAELLRPTALPSEVSAVLSTLLRAAADAATTDPDVVAQVCCALGVLTADEDDMHRQMRLRGLVDRELLREVIRKAEGAFYDFRGGQTYCTRLLERAVGCDLGAERLLSPEGAEVHELQARRDTPAPIPPVPADKAARRPAALSDISFDIYGPLRGLGVGAVPPEQLDAITNCRLFDRRLGEDEDEPDPDPGENLGVLGALFGGGQQEEGSEEPDAEGGAGEEGAEGSEGGSRRGSRRRSSGMFDRRESQRPSRVPAPFGDFFS